MFMFKHIFKCCCFKEFKDHKELCSIENLYLAFEKASKGKSNKLYVLKFEENLDEELKNLQIELELQTYKPHALTRFVVRDPKTRTIHSSHFRDRVVYHALVNIIEPIFEKIFIYDSYASRINKGTHNAVKRFEEFQRKISNNGRLVKNNKSNNNVMGYIFKADVRKYFDTVDHKIMLELLQRKIKDEKVIWLIEQILSNYENEIPGKGMPLGNLTSQFFANVYLNELDYFVKHKLKIKYYLRYVDDFVILDKELKNLEFYKEEINNFLKSELKIELHPDKSKILPLRNGITFLGYRVFYNYKLLRKSNRKKFERSLQEKLELYKSGFLTYEEFMPKLNGWFGYAVWANTYNMRNKIIKNVNSISSPSGGEANKKIPIQIMNILINRFHQVKDLWT